MRRMEENLFLFLFQAIIKLIFHTDTHRKRDYIASMKCRRVKIKHMYTHDIKIAQKFLQLKTTQKWVVFVLCSRNLGIGINSTRILWWSEYCMANAPILRIYPAATVCLPIQNIIRSTFTYSRAVTVAFTKHTYFLFSDTPALETGMISAVWDKIKVKFLCFPRTMLR